MKICTRCNKTKDLTQFYRNASQSSGYSPHCKQCHKQAYPDRLWNKTEKGKESAKKAAKAWTERNREKTNAHSKVKYHLKKGNIIKPLRCECCDALARLDAHHADYCKPLDVTWLCRSCHKAYH